MQKIEKSEIYGVIGTILFGILLILLLFLIRFTFKNIKEEDEILLAFADIEASYRSRGSEGSFYRPESADVLRQPTPKPVSAPPAPNYATQDIEQSIAIERAKAEQRQREEAAAAERLRQQQQEAERQRAEAATNRARNLTSNAFSGAGNASGAGTGTGNSGASGQGSNATGNPVGRGNSDGNSWSLAGRGLNGSIPRPQYSQNIEGKITVNIRVDENGNVTSATIGSPTTIADEILRKATLQSAQRVKFTSGTGTAYGEITYNFKLN